MIADLMERLVLDVVTQTIDSRSGDISYDADFSDLGLDQLDITYIVLELEVRLGMELPADLEDSQTISQMAASARRALQANTARRLGSQGAGPVLAAMARGLPFGCQRRRRQSYSANQRARRYGGSMYDSLAETEPVERHAFKVAEVNNSSYNEYS
jgi:acyl carrier protein